MHRWFGYSLFRPGLCNGTVSGLLLLLFLYVVLYWFQALVVSRGCVIVDCHECWPGIEVLLIDVVTSLLTCCI